MGRERGETSDFDDKPFLAVDYSRPGIPKTKLIRICWKVLSDGGIEQFQNRDGTYWLIPRVHFNRNPLTYDMRRYHKDDFPEIGMFKEREYWLMRNVKGNTFMIKNDDTRKCLVME